MTKHLCATLNARY